MASTIYRIVLNGCVLSCECNCADQKGNKKKKRVIGGKKKKVSLYWTNSFVFSLCFSIPIGEWPFPPPTLCRTCRMPLSTATMTAAWRNLRLQAASHRLVLALDPWPCLRTTMREPLQMAVLERLNTQKMVHWQVSLFWHILYEYAFECWWL